MPAFYSQPKTIDDLINHSVGRVLDLFDLDVGIVKRWKGLSIREDKPAIPIAGSRKSTGRRKPGRKKVIRAT